MPGLVRKLLIIAAADGLILQPLAQRNQRASGSVQIDYQTHTINPLLDDAANSPSDSRAAFEAHGIIGFLNVFTYSYLIAIAQKKQVAQLWGKPIFVITDVAFIPLQSQGEAALALRKASDIAKLHDDNGPLERASTDLIEDADNDVLASLEDTWLDDEVARDTVKGLGKAKEPGIAEGVISHKGAYGRFAERWFSKSGWTSGQRRNLGLSLPESSTDPTASTAPHRRKSSSLHVSPALRPLSDFNNGKGAFPEQSEDDVSSEDANTKRVTMSLLPKLLQTLKLLLMSRTFYFSYEVDISRRISSASTIASDTPLFKQFDSQYFWNRNITLPLVHGAYDELVLPIMQGFIGQRLFTLQTIGASEIKEPGSTKGVTDASSSDPESFQTVHEKAQSEGKDEFLLTLISRRTTKRAGFRYLRRGVDEDGNVANSVETEQILSKPEWTGGPVHSFVQTRGSMPLFFMQTPYTFKPAPTLHESTEANKRAMKKHFSNLAKSYGALQAVSLIDKHGVEVKIGNAYEDYVRKINEEGGAGAQEVKFNWFDFHNICRGMKFENVSVLIGELASFLASSGWTTIHQSSTPNQAQSGIIRTNCMDCLDRTNVVQSAIALHTLQQQLAAMLNDSQSPDRPVASDPTSEAFNTLWADNGDAISLSYAGTAALKGDYVRTRKRTTLGLLSDLSLTLSRYYRNLFDDFFAQAALDYVLGTVSPTVFVEFQERMTTVDPAIDLTRARQAAVTTAAGIIISDHEDLLAGWAVGAPAATSLETALAPQPPTASASLPRGKSSPTSLRAQPFRETVFLLSDKAVYSVAYDWDTEKVRGFERVELDKITKLQWGTYITETNTARQTDANRNVGLRLEFNAAKGRPQLRRMNTRTVGELKDPTSLDSGSDPDHAPEEKGSAQSELEEQDTFSVSDPRVIAFKILPQQTSATSSAASHSDREVAKQIGEEIAKAVQRQSPATVPGKSIDESASSGGAGKVIPLEEVNIVSLEEARRSTTFAESIGYGLKRLVWG